MKVGVICACPECGKLNRETIEIDSIYSDKHNGKHLIFMTCNHDDKHNLPGCETTYAVQTSIRVEFYALRLDPKLS